MHTKSNFNRLSKIFLKPIVLFAKMVLLGQIFAEKIWVIAWVSSEFLRDATLMTIEGGRRKGEEGESFQKIYKFCVFKN